MYGVELILDLHDCNPETFTRESIDNFFIYLCDLIDMERCDRHFWDYEGQEEEYEKAPDHLKGGSAIQFISTSNITIHLLDVLKKVFINVFSCKDFDVNVVKEFSVLWFKGKIVNCQVVKRM